MHIPAPFSRTIARIGAMALLLILGLQTRLAAQSGDTLTLQHAIELTLANAPTLDQATAMLQATEARTRLAQNANSLRVEAGADYTRVDPVPQVTLPVNGHDVTLSFAPNDNYSAAISVDKLLYDFGANDARVAAARSLEAGAKDNLDQIRTSLAYQVALAYAGLSVVEQSLRLQAEQKAILEQSIGISTERERLGATTNLEVLNTQVRIAQIESQVADLQSTREKQAAQLRRLIGWSPSHRVLVSSNLATTETTPNVEALIHDAIDHRPELVVAHDQETSAKMQIEAAKAGDRPYLAAHIAGGVKDGYLPNLTDPKLNWSGTLKFAVPIFDGGRTEIHVEEAEANLRATQAHTAELERGIAQEVQLALADQLAAKQKLGFIQTQIAQATRALELTTTRYKNGAATNLEFLTAESNLEQSQMAQLTAKFAYQYSELQLKKALGTKIW